LSPPNPEAVFCPSRTTDFLERLLEQHRPRLWLFGHHHRDWRYREGETLFVCVGELSYVDIDRADNVRGPQSVAGS
jgi:predicted phosphodiesterase